MKSRNWLITAALVISVGVSYAAGTQGSKPFRFGRETTVAGGQVIRKVDNTELSRYWAVFYRPSEKDQDPESKAFEKAREGIWNTIADGWMAASDPKVTADVVGSILRDVSSAEAMPLSLEADRQKKVADARFEAELNLRMLQISQNARIIALLEKQGAQKGR